MGKIFNPYLPLGEYIPDGEPHVFGDRLYIFGSHDIFGTKEYCSDNYVCWSCSVKDLSTWECEGEIYNINRHPNGQGKGNLYAPDVVQGNDGMYYLYYSIANSSIISVAKADRPGGQYEYYGDVCYPDGRVVGTNKEDWFQFDPAVLNDEGKIWLFSGSGQKFNKKFGHPVVGVFVMELEEDMLTMKQLPKIIMPFAPSFTKPNFFEASSIRKFGKTYYFVYAPTNHSGLHYCTSDHPNKNFVYRGPIHSSSDLGIGRTKIWNPKYPVGNSHGGIVKIEDRYYIFDHRMTNKTLYERQGVAERIHIGEDGRIEQVEATSQGLHGKPLPARGTYPAVMAANLYSQKLLGRVPYLTERITETREPAKEFFITNIRDQAVIGYKYFQLEHNTELTIRARGTGIGRLELFFDESLSQPAGAAGITTSASWKDYTIIIQESHSIHPVFLRYRGKGSVDLLSITF